MKFPRAGFGVLALLLLSGPVAGSARAEGAKPVQLALFTPVQIFPEKESISGVRLNLIYGSNQNVNGLDWGLVNRVRGSGFSWQAGAVGLVEKDFTGWQDNFVSITEGKFMGFQSGAFNKVGDGSGLQLGWINVSKHMHGVQVGLVNVTETMSGLQIGVGNVIQKGKVPFLPIVNWSR